MKLANKKIIVEVEKQLKMGKSTREVAKNLKISQSYVMKIKKKGNFGTQHDKNGRPRKINIADARHMARSLINGRAKTPKEAGQIIQCEASVWTVRRALKDVGCFPSKKPKKPKLSPKNIKARRVFALSHQQWTIDDWKRVLWSDECKINRFNSDGIHYFWSNTGKATQSYQVIETVKHGGGSIMVWGCFSEFGVGPLVLVEGIMNKEIYLNILYENLPVVMGQMDFTEEDIVFQQDNDPKHASKLVRNWLEKEKFETMVWPSQSPDLNPIENLWSIVKRRLGSFETPPRSTKELWERVQDIWANIPIETCKNLVRSMPKRISAVLRNKGGFTNY